MDGPCLLRAVLLASLPLISLFPAGAHAHNCTGKRHYIASGHLALDLSPNFAARSGLDRVPIENVQVRIKRPGVSGAGGAGPTTTTDSNGRFAAHGCFPRDTNGIAPGGQAIEIQVQVRLLSDELKVRDSRKGQANWHPVAEFSARGGGTTNLGEVVYGANAISRPKFTEHAGLWWIYHREQQRFVDEGTGFQRRITVIYPHPGVLMQPEKAYADRKIHLGNDDGPEGPGEPKSILHELVHIWHTQTMRGNNASNCALGSSHKAPDRSGATRCRGFMEGLAEAVAENLMATHYGGAESSVDPVSHEDLASGEGARWTIATLDDLERSDTGWENVFRYLFARDEWAPNGLQGTRQCNARDLSAFELLNALDAANFALNRTTVEDLLQTLVDQVDGFDDTDRAIYAAVTNPEQDPVEAHAELCGLASMPAGQRAATLRRPDGRPGRP